MQYLILDVKPFDEWLLLWGMAKGAVEEMRTLRMSGYMPWGGDSRGAEAL